MTQLFGFLFTLMRGRAWVKKLRKKKRIVNKVDHVCSFGQRLGLVETSNSPKIQSDQSLQLIHLHICPFDPHLKKISCGLLPSCVPIQGPQPSVENRSEKGRHSVTRAAALGSWDRPARGGSTRRSPRGSGMEGHTCLMRSKGAFEMGQPDSCTAAAQSVFKLRPPKELPTRNWDTAAVVCYSISWPGGRSSDFLELYRQRNSPARMLHSHNVSRTGRAGKPLNLTLY